MNEEEGLKNIFERTLLADKEEGKAGPMGSCCRRHEAGLADAKDAAAAATNPLDTGSRDLSGSNYCPPVRRPLLAVGATRPSVDGAGSSIEALVRSGHAQRTYYCFGQGQREEVDPLPS